MRISIALFNDFESRTKLFSMECIFVIVMREQVVNLRFLKKLFVLLVRPVSLINES